MPWALDCGVLHAGSDGLAVRPQMKMGWATNHYHLQLGVDDLRDGLSAAAVAQVHRTYKAEGNSLVDVLKELRVREGQKLRYMDRLIQLAPWLLSQIVKLTHVDIPKGSHITAKTTLKSGFGASAGVCLGWADTRGFHMVGVRGKVGVVAKIGGDLMAGLHHTRRRVKAVVGYGNLVVELEFKLRDKATTGMPGALDELQSPGQVPLAPPEDILPAPPPGYPPPGPNRIS